MTSFFMKLDGFKQFHRNSIKKYRREKDDMNFSDEQKMIMKTASKVSCENLEPETPKNDREGSFPREGLNKLAEKEFMGLTVPAPMGGAGADTLSFVLATEAIAKGCPSTALIYATHSVIARAVSLGGSDELKGRLLSGMVSGAKLGAFASTEPNSGANAFAIGTKAVTDGDEFIVNGSKTFITSAQEADAYMVLLKTDKAQSPANISALIIEKDTPGFTFGNIEDNMGLRATSDGELFFEDCRVRHCTISLRSINRACKDKRGCWPGNRRTSRNTVHAGRDEHLNRSSSQFDLQCGKKLGRAAGWSSVPSL
jgi:alkylation response protein AidB-like acyl-CoA dehydrogenase